MRPADPYASPPVLSVGRLQRADLPATVIQAGAKTLLLELEAVRRGADLDGLRRAAAAIALPTNRWSDRTRPLPPVAWPEWRHLVEVATDMAPEIGNEAPERHLGPWAAALDAITHADVFAVCVASACLLPDVDRGTPAECWSDERLDVPERRSVLALRRLPLSIWTVVDRVDGALVLSDGVGLAPWAQPAGPVRVHGPVARVAGPGDTVVGRVGVTPEGPAITTVFEVPWRPPAKRIAAWVEAELTAARLRRRGLGIEAMLLDEGDLLCRRVHEWGWS